MRNTPYVELMRRFLKPGEVLCSCGKSFGEPFGGGRTPLCRNGCDAAQIMSGEELAARVLRQLGPPFGLRKARALSGRPASADFDLPAPNDNIDGVGHGE
jgi:hypothetical protein